MSAITKDGLDPAALAALSLDEAIARTHALLDRVIAGVSAEGKELVGVYGLYSGGNDSTTFMHLMRERMDGVIHIDTGTGIPDTRRFVEQTCWDWGLELMTFKPSGVDTYENLVLRFGFPGPAGHALMYRHLKERQIRKARRKLVPSGRRQRVIFLAGMRYTESRRRFRNAEETHRDGAIVWCSPIVHWTDEHMRAYRRRFDVPRNPVSDHLHMSGECLCGAFAKPGELEEIRFFYPAVAARIDRLQERVAAAGQHCVWGTRPPRKTAPTPKTSELLCSGCVLRHEHD